MKEGEKLTSGGPREGAETSARVPIVKKQIVKEQRHSRYNKTFKFFSLDL